MSRTNHEIEAGNPLGKLPVETPFQVVVRPQTVSSPQTASASSDSNQSDSRISESFQSEEMVQPEEMVNIGGSDSDVLSLEEIEAAYLQALEAAELADSIAVEELESTAERLSAENHAAREQSTPEPRPEPEPSSIPSVQHHSSSMMETIAASEESSSNNAPIVPVMEVDEPILTAEQVIEAILFVGGAPLPVKKFLDVLGGTYTAEQVETLLDTLNTRYLAQCRPYEIRLEEGGYRMQLTSAYEGVRGRAYGHGPKEVKLAQDALEVLAFIAYQQPVSRAGLEETGKQNVSALLRQLLRRELVCVDRSDETAGEVLRTTGRFLDLFGLTSLEDLPQVGTFNFK